VSAGIVLAMALAQTAPPVFEAHVEAVYVDVYVSAKGAPVIGLQARDFVVKDNGVAQQVRLLKREETPVTAVLALDVSSSVAGARLLALEAAARALVSGLGASDEAALVGFRHKVELREAPTGDRQRLFEAIGALRARGLTTVIDALYLCLKRRWGGGRPVLVLFTDGQDTASWLPNDVILEAARESPTLVYVVATRPEAVRMRSAPVHGFPEFLQREPPETGYAYLLRRVAETTGGAYWTVDSNSSLEARFRDVLAAVNARYLLAYEPRGVSRAGRHELRVSVKRRGLQVRARREYVVAGGR
jgi:VWFA-related protein